MNLRHPYNRAAIRKWYAEIQSLPNEIAELNANINSIRNEQEKISNAIHKIRQQEIAPRDVEVRKIEARMQALQLPNQITASNAIIEKLTVNKTEEEKHLADLKSEADRLNEEILTLHKMAEFYELKAVAEKLANQIQQEETLRAFHSDSFDRQKKNIEHIESLLESAQTNLNTLEAQKQELARFQDFHKTKSNPVSEAELNTSLTIQQNLFKATAQDLANATQLLEKSQADIQRLDNSLSQKKEKLALTQSKIAGHLAHSQPIIATPDELKAHLAKNQAALDANLVAQKNSQEKIQNDAREINIQSTQIENSSISVEKSQELALDYRNESCLKTLDDNRKEVIKVLNQTNLRIMNYEEQQVQLEEKITVFSYAIEEKKAKLQALVANEFLSTFKDSPRVLFTNLANLLRNKLAEFDASHPDTQTDEERLSLLDIKAKLALFELEAQNVATNWRDHLHLQQLLGFLHCIQARLDESVPLKKYLIEIIDTLPLDLNEAFDAYTALIQSSPGFNLKHVNDLRQSEELAYEAACERLRKTLNALLLEKHVCYQKLQDKGMAVLNIIQESKAKDKHKFNYKFNTSLLNATNDLALNPDDLPTRKHFVALTERVTAGKASFTKKLTGALIFFLGAALLAASVAAKICSFGLASPLTFLGMAAGVKAMLAGAGLFASGMERGTTRALKNVAKASERVNSLSDSVPDQLVAKLKME